WVFFFQAEDGIRDWSVTGVQTCALPIYGGLDPLAGDQHVEAADKAGALAVEGQFGPGGLRHVVAVDDDVHPRQVDETTQQGRVGIGRASCREKSEEREVRGGQAKQTRSG